MKHRKGASPFFFSLFFRFKANATHIICLKMLPHRPYTNIGTTQFGDNDGSDEVLQTGIPERTQKANQADEK